PADKDVGRDPAALMKLSVEHSFFTAGFFKEGLGRFRTWLDNLFMESWMACKESETKLLIESPSTFAAFTMTWTSTSTYPQAFASNIDLGPSYNLLQSMAKRDAENPVDLTGKDVSSVVVPKPLDWQDHVDVTGYWFPDQSHGKYTPPADLVDFIAAARKDQVPLMYIGFGSVTVSDPAAVTKAIYGAVVQSGVRAIVA
ncbi:uncharacterized protein VP01_9864g1, partial [Puccinia sorghi]